MKPFFASVLILCFLVQASAQNYSFFHARSSFEAIRKARPQNMEAVKKALNDFLINCQFKNCTANDGYIKALGLHVKEIK